MKCSNQAQQEYEIWNDFAISEHQRENIKHNKKINKYLNL